MHAMKIRNAVVAGCVASLVLCGTMAAPASALSYAEDYYDGYSMGHYEALLQARSETSYRDAYESLYYSICQAEDSVDAGWFDPATVALVNLVCGEDWSALQGGIGQLIDRQIAGTDCTLADFFVVDDQGRLTSYGIDNFFYAVYQLGEANGYTWVTYDGDSMSWNIGDADYPVIAQCMGTTEDFIRIIEFAAFDVSGYSYGTNPL